MNCTDITSCTNLPFKEKIISLESTLKQSLLNFQDLVSEFVKLHIESENYKAQLLKEKTFKSTNCSSCENLKNVVASKDNVIQSVASTLTKLNETKNFTVLNEAFKILCGETAVMTPPKDSKEMKCEKQFTPLQNMFQSPKKEFTSFTKDDVLKDDSVSEIENTPGRKSPIIMSRKLRSTTNVTSTDFRDKKKCTKDWPTPEKKMVKLSFPTPMKSKTNGKLKQARLNLIKIKQNNVVDLSCSPEFSGGSRSCGNQSISKLEIKKESMENEDTILPSPTSGPTNFPVLYKVLKDSPCKVKKSLSCLKLIKNEKESKETENIDNKLNNHTTNATKTEDSINILKQLNRFQTSPRKLSPVKIKAHEDDVTHCDIDSSMSLLQHVKKLDNDAHCVGIKQEQISPSKRPLVENINVVNVQSACDIESSMSLLRRDFADSAKRITPEKIEPVYKEPAVRKKSEKRALPGWSCDECKNFYDELYKNDPEMLAKKMDECSRHRGRNNPARPKTPTGFWYPRWNVPEDTEEFNRRNNAI